MDERTAQAVQLALDGKEEGFTYLYETTYRDKYYLALKFMHNASDAQDVLQEAYERAFRKLDTLEDPALFPQWLGRIVANTAKNALAKNKPLLFSDMESKEDDNDTVFEIEDTSDAYRPDRAYSKKETQELVQMMMESLSDEQRLCLLLFYMEGQSIKDIAETFGCSENTIKSRLHYGRNALKKKAEDLQNKGYQLFGVAPIPFVLYLLQQEATFVEVPMASAALSAGIAKQVAPKVAEKTVEKVATHAAKGFLHTVAGKVTAGILGVALLGSAAAGTYYVMQDHSQSNKEEVVVLQDKDYPSYIAGELTKEEVELVLAYGPEEMEEEIAKQDAVKYLNVLSQEAEKQKLLAKHEYDEKGRYIYDVDAINRFYASFSEYRFTSENYGEENEFLFVDEKGLHFTPASYSFKNEATITKASYKGDTMKIEYTFSHVGQSSALDLENYEKEMCATLEKQEDGFYRIIRIEECNKEENKEKTSKSDAYRKVLQAILAKEEGYDYTSMFEDASALLYRYTLYDVNQDGEMELLAQVTNDTSLDYTVVFTLEETKNGYEVGKTGEFTTGQIGTGISAIFQPQDKKGIYHFSFYRGNGEVEVHRYTLEGDTLVGGNVPEHEFIFGTDDAQVFYDENPSFAWQDMSDDSLLSSLK